MHKYYCLSCSLPYTLSWEKRNSEWSDHYCNPCYFSLKEQ